MQHTYVYRTMCKEPLWAYLIAKVKHIIIIMPCYLLLSIHLLILCVVE